MIGSAFRRPWTLPGMSSSHPFGVVQHPGPLLIAQGVIRSLKRSSDPEGRPRSIAPAKGSEGEGTVDRRAKVVAASFSMSGMTPADEGRHDVGCSLEQLFLVRFDVLSEHLRLGVEQVALDV
jgi:hypothetical protein